MKTIQITEEQLEKLIAVVKEDTFVGDVANLNLGNIAKGIKGAWRGDGYDYFSYLNTLKRKLKKLDPVDRPNEKILKDLEGIKAGLVKSKMSQSKKNNIIKAIDTAISYFSSYRSTIDTLISKLESKIG